MRILFVGLGSIGYRQAQLLLTRPGHELFALRSNLSDYPGEALPIKNVFSWQEVDAIKPDIAFITNPTALHTQTAMECARRGMKLFIEKPLAGSWEGLDEFLDIVVKRNLVTYVAYVLRFHPVIEKLKTMAQQQPWSYMHVEAASFLPTWRPGRNHLKSYSAQHKLGGGVLFDLSHEFDYVDYLMGPITQMQGKVVRLGHVTVDADDCVDIIADTKQGYASIHLSFLSHKHSRTIKVYRANQTIEADLIRNTITIYHHNNVEQVLNLSIEREALFEKQIDFFFKNLNNPRMMNNAPDAARLFKMINDLRLGMTHYG